MWTLLYKFLFHYSVLLGATAKSVDDVPAGNLCAIVGIDKVLVKTGTITTFEHAHNMKV